MDKRLCQPRTKSWQISYCIAYRILLHLGFLFFLACSKSLILVFDAKLSGDCFCIYFAANLWSHWQDDNIKGDLSLHKLISIWLTYLMYQNKQEHKVTLRCNANPGLPSSLAFLTPWQISNIHDLIIAPRPNIQDSRVSLKQNIHISVLAQKKITNQYIILENKSCKKTIKL